MKILKNYKFIPYFIIYLLSTTFLLTILNLTIGLNSKTNEIVSLLFIAIYCLLFGIKQTLKTNTKYLVSGIKYSLIHLFIIYLFGSLITSFSISIQRLLYYLIILTILLLGTVIGIKLKKE